MSAKKRERNNNNNDNAAAVVNANNDNNSAQTRLDALRAQRDFACQRTRTRMLEVMRKTPPEDSEWLTNETYVLPEVVNVVRTVRFKSPCVQSPLDLVRVAQCIPCTKYRAPKAASISVRIRPATCMIFGKGNMTVIRTTSAGEALYYSHVFRMLLEKIPIIVRYPGDTKSRIDSLEGKLRFDNGKIQNMVCSGVLPQRGVQLGRFLYEHEEGIKYDPGEFPNLIYKGVLSDGATPFCANIASTGKIVIMGCKQLADAYEAFRRVADIVADFEDPHVPTDPSARKEYRTRQLETLSQFYRYDDPSVPREVLRAGNGEDIYASDEDEEEAEEADEEEEEHAPSAAAAAAVGKGEDDAGTKRSRLKLETGCGGDDVVSVRGSKLNDNVVSNLSRFMSTPSVSSSSSSSATNMDALGVLQGDPILFKAALRGQKQNVAFILCDPSPEMGGAVNATDASGRSIFDRLEELKAKGVFESKHAAIEKLLAEARDRGASASAGKK